MIALFALRLVCGLAVTCLALPLAELPPRFFRRQMGLIFAAAIVTIVFSRTILSGDGSPYSGGAFGRDWLQGAICLTAAGLGVLSLIAFSGFVFGRRSVVLIALNLLAIGSLLGLLLPYVGDVESQYRLLMLMLDTILGAAVLGSIGTATNMVVNLLQSLETEDGTAVNLFPLQKSLAFAVLACLARTIAIPFIASTSQEVQSVLLLPVATQGIALILCIGLIANCFLEVRSPHQTKLLMLILSAAFIALFAEFFSVFVTHSFITVMGV